MGPWAQGFSEKCVVLKIIAYVQKIAALQQKTNPFKSVLKVDKIKKSLFHKICHIIFNQCQKLKENSFFVDQTLRFWRKADLREFV